MNIVKSEQVYTYYFYIEDKKLSLHEYSKIWTSLHILFLFDRVHNGNIKGVKDESFFLVF